MSWMVYSCESLCPTVLPLGHRDPPLVAGNSSLPYTLSGMSSEGAAPTDGQYGSVTFLFGFRHHEPTPQPGIDLYLL